MQNHFQDIFEEWGLPAQIRFDNGKPWANTQNRVPTSLALWLVGLGILPIFGRPRQSTDNAVVERSHGVLANWVEPEQCANLAALQQCLDEFVHTQRAEYPSCNGRSRFYAHPDLHSPRCVYRRRDDESLWNIQRVMDYVGQYRFTRTVEKNGRITHFTHEYFLGQAYARQHVTIYLDATTHQWIVEDRNGEFIDRFVPQQLTYLTIANMAMIYRKGSNYVSL